MKEAELPWSESENKGEEKDSVQHCSSFTFDL